MRDQFRAAAGELAAPKPPEPPRKRTRRGGAGGFTASAIATSYLKLCAHPGKHLQLWLAESSVKGRKRITSANAATHNQTQTLTGGPESAAHAEDVRGKPLREMRVRLGEAPGERRADLHVPSGSRAGPAQSEGLQQVRGGGFAAGAASGPTGVGDEFAGIAAAFSDRFARARAGLTGAALAAALKQIADEQVIAIRIALDRIILARRHFRDRNHSPSGPPTHSHG